MNGRMTAVANLSLPTSLYLQLEGQHLRLVDASNGERLLTPQET
ncbi:MAG TPA: hypothetical protein PLD25_12840 [Chloroflexota bacterium]|nr:hypothetical protein [Chloroflexota bacterium]